MRLVELVSIPVGKESGFSAMLFKVLPSPFRVLSMLFRVWVCTAGGKGKGDASRRLHGRAAPRTLSSAPSCAIWSWSAYLWVGFRVPATPLKVPSMPFRFEVGSGFGHGYFQGVGYVEGLSSGMFRVWAWECCNDAVQGLGSSWKRKGGKRCRSNANCWRVTLKNSRRLQQLLKLLEKGGAFNGNKNKATQAAPQTLEGTWHHAPFGAGQQTCGKGSGVQTSV